MSDNFLLRPSYDLALAQRLASIGKVLVSQTATYDALCIGLTASDILTILDSLEPKHFYKSMVSRKRPGFYQDVYHITYKGIDIYYKIQLDRNHNDATDFTVVISCKEGWGRG